MKRSKISDHVRRNYKHTFSHSTELTYQIGSGEPNVNSRPGIRDVPVAGPDTRVWQALSLPRNTSHQKGGWGNYGDLAGSGIVDIRAEIV